MGAPLPKSFGIHLQSQRLTLKISTWRSFLALGNTQRPSTEKSEMLTVNSPESALNQWRIGGWIPILLLLGWVNPEFQLIVVWDCQWDWALFAQSSNLLDNDLRVFLHVRPCLSHIPHVQCFLGPSLTQHTWLISLSQGLPMYLTFCNPRSPVWLPWWLSRKESGLQCRRPRFDPWVRKIPWRREWLPPPVFLPGEIHGQRSLGGYSPRGCKELDTTERQTLPMCEAWHNV